MQLAPALDQFGAFYQWINSEEFTSICKFDNQTAVQFSQTWVTCDVMRLLQRLTRVSVALVLSSILSLAYRLRERSEI